MNKQIVHDHPSGGWISLAEVAAVAGVNLSTLQQIARDFVTPHERVFPGSNGVASLALTFAEARELLDARRATGYVIPRQDWETA